MAQPKSVHGRVYVKTHTLIQSNLSPEARVEGTKYRERKKIIAKMGHTAYVAKTPHIRIVYSIVGGHGLKRVTVLIDL
jgi:hypothetical protein